VRLFWTPLAGAVMLSTTIRPEWAIGAGIVATVAAQVIGVLQSRRRT
jgi:hypothetical protein